MHSSGHSLHPHYRKAGGGIAALGEGLTGDGVNGGSRIAGRGCGSSRSLRSGVGRSHRGGRNRLKSLLCGHSGGQGRIVPNLLDPVQAAADTFLTGVAVGEEGDIDIGPHPGVDLGGINDGLHLSVYHEGGLLAAGG